MESAGHGRGPYTEQSRAHNILDQPLEEGAILEQKKNPGRKTFHGACPRFGSASPKIKSLKQWQTAQIKVNNLVVFKRYTAKRKSIFIKNRQ